MQKVNLKNSFKVFFIILSGSRLNKEAPAFGFIGILFLLKMLKPVWIAQRVKFFYTAYTGFNRCIAIRLGCIIKPIKLIISAQNTGTKGRRRIDICF